MAAKHKRQYIEIPDYGDDWINRLALITATIAKMDTTELAAMLNFINSKYTRG